MDRLKAAEAARAAAQAAADRVLALEAELQTAKERGAAAAAAAAAARRESAAAAAQSAVARAAGQKAESRSADLERRLSAAEGEERTTAAEQQLRGEERRRVELERSLEALRAEAEAESFSRMLADFGSPHKSHDSASSATPHERQQSSEHSAGLQVLPLDVPNACSVLDTSFRWFGCLDGP